MTIDELEKKIIEIKKRGLNIIVENELIATLRGDYYEKLIDRRMNSITELFRKNVRYLGVIHQQAIYSEVVKEHMGLNPEVNINKIIYGNYNVSNLKAAIIVAEFYGLPVEYLLFTDLEANAKTLKEQYPALYRQSRN